MSSQTEKQLKEHIQYLKKLDIISNTISKSINIETLISNVIKDIFEIFNVDRAWLLYPCNPKAQYFKILYVYTKFEYPGLKIKEKYLIDDDISYIHKKNIITKDVCTESIDSEYYKNMKITKLYNMKSQMSIALFPDNDIPWLLGVHQCSYNRNWKKIEKELFKEISSRLTMALNQLVIYTELEKSEFRFREVINQAGDSIILHDFDGNILDANKCACKNLGYYYDELILLDIFDIEISVTKSNIKQLWEKLKTDKYLKINGIQKRKNKTTFTVESNLSYLNIAGQEQIMIITRDITEHIHAEQEKLELKNAMFHTQKLESLGILAGSIAHDFNNLLAIIQGNNELAIMTIDKFSPIQKNLKKIAQASKKAAYLTDQMLAYSGKSSFNIEDIYINKLITGMVQLLKTSISKKATLQIKFAKNIGTFNGDSTQIQQIIMNLIINASESLENKDGLIKITTKEINYEPTKNYYKTFFNKSIPLLAGKYIYIEVLDSGCGMNDETKDKIYEPFYTTKLNGRGLGMSAILGIIKSHKGAINIYSEENQGTIIKIIFPKNNSDVLFKKNYKSNYNKIWKNSGFILLADDEREVAEIAKDYLVFLGFDVFIVYNGEDAVNNYKKHFNKYKYVILDLNMPKLDGIQAFIKMRKINPDIKAFIHSGYNDKYISKKYKHYGLAGFIQKPYLIKNLIELLKNVD